MEYLLRASIVLAMFYGCYKLFLQRDTFFESNRWFLLIGLITAFTLPFIIIPIYIEYTPAPIQNIAFTETPVEVTEAPISIWYYVFNFYLIGVACFALRFCIQLVSLLRLIAKNKKQKQQGYTFVETTNNTPPFSFFRWMVYNPNQFSKAELEHIISHENVHVKEFHTIDIIMSQLAAIVFWFNPIIWFYKKDLQQNLEFIADDKAQHANTNTKSYEKLLLKTCVPDLNLALTNNFYSSLIKKRIVMLHKSKSKKRNLIKYAFVLPFLAIFLMSFNTEEVYVTKTTQGNNTLGKIAETYIIKKNTSDAELKKIKQEITEKGGTFSYTQKRNNKNEIIHLVFEIKNHGTGNYESEPPFKEVYFGTLQGGGIFIAEDEKNYKDMLKRENDSLKKPQLKTVIGYPASSSTSLTSLTNLKTNGNPLYILNGKEIPKYELASVDRNSIESISVIKNETAKVLYGEKAKDGVVIITTKKDWETKFTVGKPFNSNNNQVEFAVYGKITNEQGVGLPNADIMIKGTSSGTLSDFKGNYSIKVRKGETLVFSDIGYITKSITVKDEKTINVTLKSDSAEKDIKKVLLIIDGKEEKTKTVEDVDVNTIKSVTILKDENETKKYGDKGKNGVIEITTKKE